MTAYEIILEIADQYIKHPENRSLTTRRPGLSSYKHCVYKGENDTICAFAYVVKPESRDKLVEQKTAKTLFGEGSILMSDIQDKYIPSDITDPEELVKFYSNLQRMHDSPDAFWPSYAWSSGWVTGDQLKHLEDIQRIYVKKV